MTTVLKEAPTERIVPTPFRIGWVEARKLIRGELPSNALLDWYLANADRCKPIVDLFPAWAREVLVYPGKGSVFKAGRDVADSLPDHEGRSWMFSASYMPEEAIGARRVALFVDPEEVIVRGKTVEIIPKFITVLKQFRQTDGWGKPDAKTRVPLAPRQYTDQQDRRYLRRTDGAGVRPLARGFGIFDNDSGSRSAVDASHPQDYPLGVGTVCRTATTVKAELESFVRVD
jgi:hypothetical protein